MGYFSQIVVEVEEMYMQGYTKTRIAEILNLPYHTVESYLSNIEDDLKRFGFEETSND